MTRRKEARCERALERWEALLMSLKTLPSKPPTDRIEREIRNLREKLGKFRAVATTIYGSPEKLAVVPAKEE